MGRVIHGKVAIKLLSSPSQTEGGIYVPENAKKNEVKGEVVAVGASTTEEKIEVVVGDTILTSIHAGTKFEMDGEKYKLINHHDILWIF